MASQANPEKKKGILGLIALLVTLLVILGVVVIVGLDYFGIMDMASVPVIGNFVDESKDPFAGEKARLKRLEDQLAIREEDLAKREADLQTKAEQLLEQADSLQKELVQIEEHRKSLQELQDIEARLKQLSDMYASMMSSQAATSLRHVDNSLLREILLRMPSETAADIMAKLPEQKAASLAKQMGSDSTPGEGDSEREQIIAMAEMYGKMDPAVAAESIQVLDDVLASEILSEMTPESSMQVLSALPPQTASHLVSVMAGKGSSELDREKEQRLRSLALMYSGLETSQAVASLETIDEQLAIDILGRMGNADVQRLFDTMNTFKVARLVALMADPEGLAPLDEYDPNHYNTKYVASLVSKMNSSEAVSVFDGLDNALVTEVIKELDPDKARDILVSMPQGDATEVLLNMAGAFNQQGKFMENQQIKQVVDIYSAMDPANAANLLQQLNDDLTAVEILKGMTPENVGSIINELPTSIGVRWSKLMSGSYAGGSQGHQVAAEIFATLDASDVGDIVVTEMHNDVDEVVAILKLLNEEKASEIIKAIKDLDTTLAADIVLKMDN